LGRGELLRAARGTTKQLGAAGAAEMRRSGRTTRRHGSGPPARASGCYGVRERRQATRAGSSPPDADLGRLHDDETATTAREHGGDG
jgi:hypothetical protein